MSRPIALLLFLAAAAAWPLRDALLRHEVAGAGPDVVVTLWAMWWFAVEGMGRAVDNASMLANHPYGATGTVLAPLTAMLYAALRTAVGDTWASNLVGLTTLVGVAGGTAWTARGLRLGWTASLAAGLAVFVARYPLYALGETSVVGITAVPMVFGLGAWVRGRWGVVVVCAGLVALEYPYLTPLLPGLALLRAVHERSRRWALVAAAALLAALCGALVVGRGQVEGFSLPGRAFIPFLGRAWPAAEEEQARAQLGALLWPGEVRWSPGGRDSIFARGRDYLGLSVLVLGAFGGRRALPWLGLGALAVLVALGSDFGGAPGLFSLLNLVAREVVRPLTQPTRFLLLANVAFAVAAAVGVERLGRRGLAAIAVLLADALLVGGLSLQLPSFALPRASCVASLEGREGVVVWPWDANPKNPDATLRTRLWQIEHGQPGSTFGVGSWTLGQGRRAVDALRDAGLAEGLPVPVGALLQLGFDTIVVDHAGSPTAPSPLQQPAARCEGAEVYFLR